MNAVAPAAVAANDANLAVALHLAAHGLPVFPCNPADKSPYTPNGYKDAATDELTIRRWWKQHSDAVPGISCEAARLVVIDCDVKEGINGIAELLRIAVDDGLNLNASPSVLTQNNGAHCYYRAPPDFKPSNKTGSLPKGLDVRSAGYVIAPGAVLPDGRRYIADLNTPDLAEAYKAGTIPMLPDKLRARIEAGKRKEAAPAPVAAAVAPSPVPAPQPGPGAATARERANAEQALRKAAADLASRGPGTGRNGALNTAALAMGELVGAGWISRGAVEEALRDASRRNGYADKDGEDAVARTLHSGLQAGIAKPRTPLAATDPPMVDVDWNAVRAADAARAGRIEGSAAAVAAHCGLGGGAAPQLWTTADFALATHEGYVVKGLIAPGNVCALLGQPGAGKSTLAPYLAYAVARGLRVFGLRTRQGRTLYLAAEDAAGVKKRLYALGEKHGHTKDCAVLECGNLRDPAQQAAVAAAVASFKPTLVVLDTVAAAFAGMDENTSQDMGLVVAWAQSIAATGAAVLLVHHPAKASKDDNAATARGHGSLNGALDMTLILAPGDVTDANTLVRGTLGKNRNGTTARRFAFRKEVVVLGQDADKDDVTTTLPTVVDEAAYLKYTENTIAKAQEIISSGSYRKDKTSHEWVGYAVGHLFGYTDAASSKREIEALIDTLVRDGWLKYTDRLAANRHMKTFVEAAKAAVAMPFLD